MRKNRPIPAAVMLRYAMTQVISARLSCNADGFRFLSAISVTLF
jgi:hypothetical protein